MELARIDGGTIAEIRNVDPHTIPAHRRAQWRPVDGDKPAYDATVLALTGPVYTIEATRVLRTWTVAFKPLADLQALKRAMAWAECERRLETATATITIAGTAYPFGADAESRENIMGAVTAINAGVGIPNPRSWTPKGALQPPRPHPCRLDCNRRGAALLNAKDAHLQIMALTDPVTTLR